MQIVFRYSNLLLEYIKQSIYLTFIINFITVNNKV